MGRSSNRQTTTQRGTSRSSSSFDPFITEGSQFAVGRAREIADRPYTAYEGDRIAALSDNEQRGMSQAAIGYGEANDYFRRGAVGFNDAFSSGAIQPYLDNLANPIIREINRDYEDSRRSLESNAAVLGAFGNDRVALERGAMERNYLERVDDTRRAAFGTAIDVFNQDQNRLMQAGGALAQTQSQQVRDLMETGGVQRILDQAQADFDYAQFLEARDWDINNLTPLLNTLSSVPKNQTQNSSFDQTTTTETESRPDAFGQVLGAAATVAGAYFTGGASLALGAGASAASGAMTSNTVPATGAAGGGF